MSIYVYIDHICTNHVYNSWGCWMWGKIGTHVICPQFWILLGKWFNRLRKICLRWEDLRKTGMWTKGQNHLPTRWKINWQGSYITDPNNTLLLMEKILHHWDALNTVNDGIYYQINWFAGFLNHQQYYRWNPSKLPFPCIVWSLQMSNLMAPGWNGTTQTNSLEIAQDTYIVTPHPTSILKTAISCVDENCILHSSRNRLQYRLQTNFWIGAKSKVRNVGRDVL